MFLSRILARHRPPARPLVRLVSSTSSPPVLGREGSIGKHPFDVGRPPPASSASGGGGGAGGAGNQDKIRDGPTDPIAGPSGRLDGPMDPIAGPSGRPRDDQPQPVEAQTPSSAQNLSSPPTPPPPDLLADALPLPPAPAARPSRPPATHPFDTYAFVSRLAAHGVEPMAARTLMEAVRSMIGHRTHVAQARMLSREEMDNDAYRFKAALSDIRTGHSMRSRRDGLAVRSATSATRREVDGLELKLKEDIAVMRHDIEIETNTRKDETRSVMKRFDIAREEINNKFTISLGDLRTEIEGAKWDATRRAIAIILVLVVMGVVLSTLGKPASVPPTAMVDAAVGTEEDEPEWEGSDQVQGPEGRI
ncbi:hypothetical protein CspeluHIS016_0702050 [Cutaneotrichosporon spelunceum]|uniref:DUF1640-domain-containing protein n=1 Tax=Cutaneotrichosporon spelunceum TaxID=1672016 RepID=A0AAD3TYF1_9TREE|nr:hypothetical protein CspeluHIS016_0702050 [Cutaneotrichosporon spelunceum]